jgi:hypothetical protein
MAYSYACTEYPGMEGCPGRFTAGTEDERRQIRDIIRRD